MRQYRLLDLFSGAGGCAVGYSRAGFNEIVGIDIEPQKRYPFSFIEMDVLDAFYLLLDRKSLIDSRGKAWNLQDFDAIHASPPCQKYSKTKRLASSNHPMLIEPTRDFLTAVGKPYVIENVVGAPLIDPACLHGALFGLKTMRPRLFECSFNTPKVADIPKVKYTKMGRPPKYGEYIHIAGHISGVEYCKNVMGINWMTGKELVQAIPPIYTEWIGKYLLESISK